MLMGIATALAIIYLPISMKGLRAWELKYIKEGAKT